MVDEGSLNWMRREITRITRSETELKEFMFLLNQTNWTQVFESDLKKCSACGLETLYTKIHWNATWKLKACCPDCYQKTIDGYEGQCKECGSFFFTKDIGDDVTCVECYTKLYGKPCLCCKVIYWPWYNTMGLCEACRNALNISYNKIYSRVLGNLRRARLLDLPATLTIEEWTETLLHFNFLCAYCLTNPSTQLDHFVPLSKKGGTTRGNCVPCCLPCNKLKHQRHPDKVTAIPLEALNRVRSYLEQFSDTSEIHVKNP